MKKEVYKKIVSASGIKKGDLVVIQYWMNGTLSSDVMDLQAQIVAHGATPILMIQNREMNQRVLEEIQDTTFDDRYFQLFENADFVIDLMECPIGLLNAPLAPEKMGLCGQYMQRLFATCSKKKMLQIRMATEEMARAEGLAFEVYAKNLEKAMDIDYKEINVACREKIEQLKKHDTMTIYTGNRNEYTLTFELGAREWFMDAGDGDLPCGEVYIAPLEDRTRGDVFFEKIYMQGEQRGSRDIYENVIFHVEKGSCQVVAPESLKEIFQEMEPKDRMVCELGFGMNPNVDTMCGCTLFDEKMRDTFHIAIGENTMFGGNNEADCHIDFVGKGVLEI